MNFRLGIASALVVVTAAGIASAQQQPPPGRVYVFHSTAQGGCPALDWHVGVSGDTLEGMIAWDNMKAMAHATGKLNMSNRTFEMTAKEVGGQGRTATVSGQVQPNGYLVANVKGPKVDCQGITVPWFVPSEASRG
jgi:hypothetical protein